MGEVSYPEMILNLPDINIQRPGVVGKLLQAGHMQVVFFELEPIGAIEPHSHGEQWGIIVDGEIELTIGGVVHHLKKGDSYYIPAGVEHSARVVKKVKAIDFFNEPDRYQPLD